MSRENAISKRISEKTKETTSSFFCRKLVVSLFKKFKKGMRIGFHSLPWRVQPQAFEAAAQSHLNGFTYSGRLAQDPAKKMSLFSLRLPETTFSL